MEAYAGFAGPSNEERIAHLEARLAEAEQMIAMLTVPVARVLGIRSEVAKYRDKHLP